jgi:hypothetical protein
MYLQIYIVSRRSDLVSIGPALNENSLPLPSTSVTTRFDEARQLQVVFSQLQNQSMWHLDGDNGL